MMNEFQPRERLAADAGEQGGGRGKPEHFHARQLEQFTDAIAREGEAAIKRWGLPMFHSLPDEQVQAQRQTLGFPVRDALDHYNQGCLLAIQGDFNAAVKAFDHALKLNADFPEAAFNRALALDQGGNINMAREAYQDFIEKNPESEEAAEIKLHLATLIS